MSRYSHFLPTVDYSTKHPAPNHHLKPWTIFHNSKKYRRNYIFISLQVLESSENTNYSEINGIKDYCRHTITRTNTCT